MGKLFVTAVPIGNYEDITLRAVKILKEVDFVICEEFKEANRLFAKLGFRPKDLVSLNEHNEKENASEIIAMLKSGKNAALISDGGTPVFSDPGKFLIELAYANKIEVSPIPGANSVIAALSVSGLDISRFYFAGWLPVKKDARRKRLNELKSVRELLVLMETPYRLRKLLAETTAAFGKNKFAVLAYNLTLPDEKIFRDKLENLSALANKEKLKGEFVLLIENRK